MRETRLVTKNNEIIQIVFWLAGFGLLVGLAVLLFVPLHEAAPAPDDLVKKLEAAQKDWDHYRPSHYQLEIRQARVDNKQDLLKVEVLGERVIRVIEVPPAPYDIFLQGSLKKEEATIDKLFSLLRQQIKDYRTFWEFNCQESLTFPAITYDSRSGYPIELQHKTINLLSNFEIMNNRTTCRIVGARRWSDGFSAKIIPLSS